MCSYIHILWLTICDSGPRLSVPREMPMANWTFECNSMYSRTRIWSCHYLFFPKISNSRSTRNHIDMHFEHSHAPVPIYIVLMRFNLDLESFKCFFFRVMVTTRSRSFRTVYSIDVPNYIQVGTDHQDWWHFHRQYSSPDLRNTNDLDQSLQPRYSPSCKIRQDRKQSNCTEGKPFPRSRPRLWFHNSCHIFDAKRKNSLIKRTGAAVVARFKTLWTTSRGELGSYFPCVTFPAQNKPWISH